MAKKDDKLVAGVDFEWVQSKGSNARTRRIFTKKEKAERAAAANAPAKPATPAARPAKPAKSRAESPPPARPAKPAKSRAESPPPARPARAQSPAMQAEWNKRAKPVRTVTADRIDEAKRRAARPGAYLRSLFRK